jgi:hypothetical protein
VAEMTSAERGLLVARVLEQHRTLPSWSRCARVRWRRTSTVPPRTRIATRDSRAVQVGRIAQSLSA